MSDNKPRHVMKKGNKKDRFIGIPYPIAESPDYVNLSGNAVKLLNAMLYQYNGRNNGDLSTAYSILKQHGFRSRGTIDRVKRELVRAGLIEKTREGKFVNPGGVCELWAVTWHPINECGGKLDVEATTKPKRIFTLEKLNRPVSK